MAKRYQFSATEAKQFAELRARQETARIARAYQYQATKVAMRMNALEAVRATTAVTYAELDQVGIFNRVRVDVSDPFDVRVERTVGADEMKKMERAIAMHGRTKILYQKFVNRCLVLAFRSSYHANDSTTIGYLRNTPLMYNGHVGIGYASGKLYDSIRIRSVAFKTDAQISKYGEFSQELMFNGPAYESYGKILGTGVRKQAPIRILPLMAWVRTKIARGVWKGKDRPKNTKGVLALAIRISQSYSGVTKHGMVSNIRTRKRGGIYSTTAKKRERSIPDWHIWNKNTKARRMFQKYHDKGITKYYQMVLNDIKIKFNQMYGS